MNKLILSMAAVAAIAAAAPAYADHERRYDDRRHAQAMRSSGSWMRSVEARANELANAVGHARHSGHLDSYTASSLMGQLKATVSVAKRYRQNGVTRSEFESIDGRFAQHEYRLRTGGHDRRQSGYRW